MSLPSQALANILDNASLIAAIEQGQAPAYLYFWGHRQKVDGTPDKSCFSQWFEAGFKEQGILYPSAEHYMMAGKARLFNDPATLAKILAASTPAEAKKLGREVAGYDDAAWVAERSAIVEQANLLKFEQNPGLRKFLLSTDGQVLVEASPVDRIWGIGLDAKAPQAADPRQWQGLNLLGYALMRVRERLA
ncbi:NADAR family protein [Pseudomonas rubra]|uniref:NADAR family protein n=1 Tax=Pseudomonas rubra TaxID=2942627 RepID=A0ABT5PDX6_9PSED|nr:NADAR family protein [Pseudomonas rubra]MDD1016514.1 NADAR family protein [Pseudomonas rubra]MDD1038516.1 NADAR family protein [Pseudomonas rubra]MDD1156083.1 NADAR family protein [Pseudomonas rubra]